MWARTIRATRGSRRESAGGGRGDHAARLAGDGSLFPLFAPMFPEATQAWEEIVAYIKKHLDLG
jgi:hypothetical protein